MIPMHAAALWAHAAVILASGDREAALNLFLRFEEGTSLLTANTAPTINWAPYSMAQATRMVAAVIDEWDPPVDAQTRAAATSILRNHVHDATHYIWQACPNCGLLNPTWEYGDGYYCADCLLDWFAGVHEQ
jgi:hypothetical protein